MTRFSDEIQVNAPKEKVWEILADLGGIQRYHPGVSKSHYTSEQKQGVGASRHCDLVPFGTVEERAVEWNDGESYVLEIYDGEKNPPLKKALAHISVREQGDRTIVRMELDYKLKFGPLGALLDALFVRKQFEKVVPGLLAGFKHYIETGEEVDRALLKRLRAQAAA